MILNSNWSLKRADQSNWQQARVPGSIYTDLLKNGQMEDPFFKDNEAQALALMEYNYEYQCGFDLAGCKYSDENILSHQKQYLQFEGIDTIADIYLNGQKLGSTCNMHRKWEFDVTGVVKEKNNVLRVLLNSPTRYIREAFQKCRTLGADEAMDGFVHIRKAHCMFGWDWGAHLPDAGIYRKVSLYGASIARIESAYIKQHHKKGLVELEIDPEIRYISEEEKNGGLTVEVIILDPKGREIIRGPLAKKIAIEKPWLWWPNGYGDQPLYTIVINVHFAGQVIDFWQRRIGLRTMTIHQEKDEWGESFAHRVNGKDIFAMGADYIPEDHLLGRTSKERTQILLKDCIRANFNTIRVWGGGYYPEDWFFDLCDELGLIVWQDFMFACAIYELTPEFKENIRQELSDNIKRIRHHASLGLWCGNNEMEMFIDEGCHWIQKRSEVRDYIIMYEQLIPEMLKELDPETFYWPASPSSGGSFDVPNDPNRGDVHFWEVWHGNKPFSEYRKYHFRYLSEFGFQSFPSIKTIETFTDDPRDYNPFSYIMEKHQRNYGANGKIMNYLQQTFRYPNSFKLFIFASQLLQAEAIRYGVEHFRRNRGRCMGAVYWQLNDCWPVVSWSSIDYTGRWKALHYYARRFFAPLMISCQEEGMMSKGMDLNNEYVEFEKSITLNVANETLDMQKVTVFWALRNVDGSIVSSGEEAIEVLPLTSVWLEKIEFPSVNEFKQYASYELRQGGNVISEGTALFSYPKYFQYQDPHITYRIKGDEIILNALTYAKSVEIQNEGEDLILSDNYFDMNAGEKRVKVLGGSLTDISIRSVYNIQ